MTAIDGDVWHYTCRHRAALIGRRGLLVPASQPLFQNLPLIWLTDLAVPDVEALGLTSTTLACDRTECRYRVADVVNVRPWLEFAEQMQLDRRTVSTLTLGRQPRHWFVSTTAVRVRAA